MVPLEEFTVAKSCKETQKLTINTKVLDSFNVFDRFWLRMLLIMNLQIFMNTVFWVYSLKVQTLALIHIRVCYHCESKAACNLCACVLVLAERVDFLHSS